jgi:exodeoxyribonuclease VII large subunit
MKQADLFSGSSGPATPDEATSARPPQRSSRHVVPPVSAQPAPPNPIEVAAVPAWRKPPGESLSRKVLTVSELTSVLKETIEPRFSRLIVRGEVTGFRGTNARGHLYFAIKDAGAQIDVRVWQSLARTLRFQLRDGLALLIEGALNVYEVQGRYSLIAQKLEPEGVGAMALAFEQLKAKLVKEGLIGEGRIKPRRTLPTLPRRIGVVTSSSGAAWRDFLKVLHRRHPGVSVLFCNARVQGDDAALEVARGLRWLSRTDVDVIVVTRGGGSVEDLWTFNEERVVRAIFNSPVPVVSAIGHETDLTLSDLVADFRAPTPSAAAEAVVPVVAEVLHRLHTTRRRLAQAVERRVLEARHELQVARGTLGDPRRRLTSRRLTLSDLGERMRRAHERAVRSRQRALLEIETRLGRLRPQTRVAERRAAFAGLTARVQASLTRRLREERSRLARVRLSIERSSPRPNVREARRRIESAATSLPLAVRRFIERERLGLGALSARLDALSPLKVLGRGYAIVARHDVVVRRAADVQRGDLLTVRLDQSDSLVVRVESSAGGKDEG